MRLITATTFLLTIHISIFEVEYTPINIGEKVILHSETISEECPLWICVPKIKNLMNLYMLFTY